MTLAVRKMVRFKDTLPIKQMPMPIKARLPGSGTEARPKMVGVTVPSVST